MTDETNTKAEKAEYLAEVFACFERLLGPVAPDQAMSMSTMRAPRPMATVGGHKKRGSISPDIPVTRISRLKGHCPDKFSGTSIPRSFRRVLKDLSDVHGGRAAILCYELMKSFLNFGEMGHRQSDFIRSGRIAPVRRVGQRNMLAADHWTVLVNRSIVPG